MTFTLAQPPTPYLSGWEIPAEMSPAEREELGAWLRGLGVEPADIAKHAVLTGGGEHTYLNASRFVRDADGRKVVDYALNEVVTLPLIVEIGPRSTWPRCIRPRLSAD